MATLADLVEEERTERFARDEEGDFVVEGIYGSDGLDARNQEILEQSYFVLFGESMPGDVTDHFDNLHDDVIELLNVVLDPREVALGGPLDDTRENALDNLYRYFLMNVHGFVDPVQKRNFDADFEEAEAVFHVRQGEESDSEGFSLLPRSNPNAPSYGSVPYTESDIASSLPKAFFDPDDGVYRANVAIPTIASWIVDDTGNKLPVHPGPEGDGARNYIIQKASTGGWEDEDGVIWTIGQYDYAGMKQNFMWVDSGFQDRDDYEGPESGAQAFTTFVVSAASPYGYLPLEVLGLATNVSAEALKLILQSRGTGPALRSDNPVIESLDWVAEKTKPETYNPFILITNRFLRSNAGIAAVFMDEGHEKDMLNEYAGGGDMIVPSKWSYTYQTEEDRDYAKYLLLVGLVGATAAATIFANWAAGELTNEQLDQMILDETKAKYPHLFDAETNYSDRDEDGMPDEWEIRNKLNPDMPNDAQWDMDDDGIVNLDEYLGGTLPWVPDTVTEEPVEDEDEEELETAEDIEEEVEEEIEPAPTSIFELQDHTVSPGVDREGEMYF